MKFIILSIITAEPEIIVLVLIHLLYNAFIKSHVKFSSSVWNSESATVKNKLEWVQYKFLKYMFYKNHVTYTLLHTTYKKKMINFII